MPGRGRLRAVSWGAFGLRGRILGAVLVTTVATLVVAGALVLPRLESSLRKASKSTLMSDIRSHRKDIAAIGSIEYTAIPQPAGTSGAAERFAAAQRGDVARAQETLAPEFGATSVSLIGYVDLAGDGRRVLTPPDSDSAASSALSSSFAGVGLPYLAAADPRHPPKNPDRYSFVTILGKPYVRAVIPLPGDDAVLVVDKAVDEIPAAVSDVRQAFEIAAAAGLLLSLLLGIPLAATLVRRLRRLREAALQLAAQGAEPDLPVDRARDEVGDLGRSFAVMQARLRHQEQARRAFVATASHELRTPLTSLDGMLELLDEDLGDPALDLEDARALLGRARVQSRRLGRLAADLLDLSRIDADVALRSEPVELGELSRAVGAEFELASEERDVTVRLVEDTGPAWVLGDPGSVARIIRILLDNALRVAPAGTDVTVTVHAGAAARLTVSDAGPGVPPEERELIFERFKRGRDTRGQAGFGLGLAIGRELAERMGGRLRAADTGPPGATFELELPGAGPVPRDRPASEAHFSAPSKSSATELMQ